MFKILKSKPFLLTTCGSIGAVGYYSYTNFCSIWRPEEATIRKYFGKNSFLPMTIEMAGYIVTDGSDTLNKCYAKKIKEYLEKPLDESSHAGTMEDIPMRLGGTKLCKYLFKQYGLSGIAGLELSGKKFNEIIQNAPMYKALNCTKNHNGFQFVTGRNVDINPLHMF